MRYHTSRYSFKCFTLFKYCGFPSNSMFEYLLTYFPSYNRAQIKNALDIIWNFTSISYLELTFAQDWHPEYEKRQYYCDIIREPDYRTSTTSEHHPFAMTHIHTLLNLNVAEFFRGYIKYKLGDITDLNEAYNQTIDNDDFNVAYCLYAFYHPENSNITSTFTYNAVYNSDHVNIDHFLNKMYHHNLQ